MKYYDFLNASKESIVEQVEYSLQLHKVQPVGNGYIDCIVMKENLDQFVNDISSIGILISDVSWWCYVNPNQQSIGCPHGMGGPGSDFYDGWFSELQNDMYEADKARIESIISLFDKSLVQKLNKETVYRIRELLNYLAP